MNVSSSRSRTARWAALGLVLAAGLVAPVVAAPAPAQANPSGTGLIITEATPHASVGSVTKPLFVELYNPTNNAVDLTGWSLMHTGAVVVFGGQPPTCHDDPPMPLAGTIAAHSYFLFTTASEVATLGVTADYVSPTNATFASPFEPQTWILADTTTTFPRTGDQASGSHPNSIDTVGFSGFGPLAPPCAREGTAFTAASDNGGHRRACADTDDNAADLVASQRTSPTNASFPAQSCPLPSCNGNEATIVATGPTVTGTSGDDVILGSDTAETIDGGGGNDIICGLGGDDVITAGAGQDQVYGGPGDDEIDGGTGFDTLRGGIGDDTLTADTADLVGDQFRGGPGLDTVVGGGGDDTISGGLDADDIDGGGGVDTVNGNAGDDVVGGGAGNDVLTGGPGADTINGGDDNDTLRGSAGGDTLNGDNGDDRLIGGDDDDTLNGNDGDDRLNGGPGTDTLDGGAGHNVLVP